MLLSSMHCRFGPEFVRWLARSLPHTLAIRARWHAPAVQLTTTIPQAHLQPLHLPILHYSDRNNPRQGHSTSNDPFECRARYTSVLYSSLHWPKGKPTSHVLRAPSCFIRHNGGKAQTPSDSWNKFIYRSEELHTLITKLLTLLLALIDSQYSRQPGLLASIRSRGSSIE